MVKKLCYYNTRFIHPLCWRVSVRMINQTIHQSTLGSVIQSLGLPSKKGTASASNENMRIQHAKVMSNKIISVKERREATFSNLAKASDLPVLVTSYDRQGRLIISCAVPHDYHLTAGEFCRLFAKTVVTEPTGRYAYATVDPRK